MKEKDMTFDHYRKGLTINKDRWWKKHVMHVQKNHEDITSIPLRFNLSKKQRSTLNFQYVKNFPVSFP